ncbi:MAG TPA: D-glycerate dehydrogenase [Planctomycetota bacterium]|nr:D-glycerate dehydrogenase [Planctomycetota bacterium]
MKPRVLVTRHVYPAAIAILQEHCIVDYKDSHDVMDEAQLHRKLQHAHGLVCQLTDPITANVIDKAPHLRVISQIAVGHDNIDVPAATARRIVVTNTPGVLTEATADLTFALLLATARRLPAAERFLREGNWRRWDVDLLCGSDVHERTLGIVGFGRIGQAVAARARGFSMRVLYASRSQGAPEVEQRLQARRVPLDTLLQQSDFVTLHVPLGPETRHLIGVEQLCRMKRSAFLINTSRGPVVDEAALAAALEEGLLAGAGLDVFEREPTVHPGLLALPGVVLLPHVGSAVTSVRSLMCAIAARDCAAVLTGERPQHAVNAEVLA